ncbi:MAG: hypothetical protein K6357_06175 [Elusimicrobiota bacterium]
MSDIEIFVLNILPWLFLLLVVLILIQTFYYPYKRRNEILQMVKDRSFEYDKEGNSLSNYIGNVTTFVVKRNFFDLVFKGFEKETSCIVALASTGLNLFNRGHSKKAKNIFAISFEGKKLFFFDYYFTVGSGKHSTRYSHTVALLKTNSFLPDFYMRPENFFDSVAAIIGFDDIDISGFENFSKIYYLKGKNPDSVISFFTPERIMIFEQSPGYYVEAANNFLIIYSKSIIPVKKDYIDKIVNIFKGLKVE